MKFIFASDSFKGSLTSKRTAELLEEACREYFPDAECVRIPVADGGEGTVDALVEAVNGKRISALVHDPLQRVIGASFGALDNHTAVIEMSSASGLPLLKKEERNPCLTSSYGTGELIRKALAEGYRDIYLAIGGSATNDGGTGAMRALGYRFFDRNGNETDGRGMDLVKIASVDEGRVDPLLQEAHFTVLSDVRNPLCGKEGATLTFGAQKGADAEMMEDLEVGMCNYRDVIRRQYGIDVDKIPGSGAAGGLGAALAVFLKAEMKSGIDAVLDLLNFDEKIRGADLIVTGEGRTDWQTCFGKVVQGVGDRAMKAGIPVVDLCGSTGEGYESVYTHGILEVLRTATPDLTMEESMENAEDLYLKKARELFRTVKERR